MESVILILVKCIGIILLADFLTGVFHFWLDQYGREDMPLVGKMVVEINILHHKDPRHMIFRDYWFLTRASWGIGIMLWILEYLLLGGIGWGGILLVVYGAQANIIHKWAHQTPNENGKLIVFLQKLQLIQSSKQHWQHHIKPYDTYFCILTNFLNPVLEKIKFWECIIGLLSKLGIKPVAGSSIRKGA